MQGFLHTITEQSPQTHSGEWMNHLTSDTVVVSEGLATIVPGVAGMVTKMAGALVVILIMEPRFAYIPCAWWNTSGAAYLYFQKAAKKAAQADAGERWICLYLLAGASWQSDDRQSIWQGSGQSY